uniref:M3 family metallopeptidase n=1 Tax=Alloprevotella sp. TaxID=1872471 RepID=UPI003FEFAA34
MIKEFITTQLLTNKEWNNYIKNLPTAPLANKEAEIGNAAAMLRPLIMQGMDEEMSQVEAIVNNAEAPTFANTIVALSNTGENLERATAVMYNLLSAETNDELEELANELAPKLSEHSNNIMLNAKLFERVKAVYDAETNQLEGEDKMLLDKTYEGFERSGATLSADDKLRFREITSQLSEKTLKFSQNVLKETNNFILHITNENDLAGIPEIHRNAARHEAETRNKEGWGFTLHAPSFMPFMMYADNRTLREKMYRAYNSRCTHNNEYNNFEIVRSIVNLRREVAQILGYEDYADYALRRRMAQNASNVYKLLNDLITHYLPRAKEDVAEVEKKAQQLEGSNFKLQPWDFSYYSQKLKHELYDYDPDMLRPYFELSQVQKGVLGLATRLYGITFKRNEKLPVYQKDVIAYDVYDKEGAYLAILLVDFFPRESKKGGAWMTNYRDESCAEPTNVKVLPTNSTRPVVSVTTNFTKPTANTPALLTLGEVETFLHEFGHALHGIFAMTHYASLSGTSVYWDFVELPSQFMENYATEPEFLGTFAHHYQTGEPLPQAYIDRIRKSRNFQSAYACMRQVSFGLLDMAYYTLRTPLTADIKTFEDEAWKRVQLLPQVADACMSVEIGHIMSGGYAAGYYSYKWAEVLDADAFSLFKEKGIFNESVAQSFRQNILSKGGTENPMDLYTRFRGQAPTINALLKRDGIQQ